MQREERVLTSRSVTALQSEEQAAFTQLDVCLGIVIRECELILQQDPLHPVTRADLKDLQHVAALALDLARKLRPR
jgi:hypothetical protein